MFDSGPIANRSARSSWLKVSHTSWLTLPHNGILFHMLHMLAQELKVKPMNKNKQARNYEFTRRRITWSKRTLALIILCRRKCDAAVHTNFVILSLVKSASSAGAIAFVALSFRGLSTKYGFFHSSSRSNSSKVSSEIIKSTSLCLLEFGFEGSRSKKIELSFFARNNRMMVFPLDASISRKQFSNLCRSIC